MKTEQSHTTPPNQDMRLHMRITQVANMLRHGQAASKEALAPAQRRVLALLGTHGSMTQQRLLDEMGITAASLSELISKLEGKGFVTRSPLEQDKRFMVIELTSEGELEAAEMMATDHAIARDVFAGLSDAEKQQLETLLDRIASTWVRM